MITWAQVRDRYDRAECEPPERWARWCDSPTDDELLQLIDAGAKGIARAAAADDNETFDRIESERDDAVDDLDRMEHPHDRTLRELESMRTEIARLIRAELERLKVKVLDDNKRKAIHADHYPTAWGRIARDSHGHEMATKQPINQQPPDDAQTRFERVLEMIDDQSATLTRMLSNLAMTRAATVTKWETPRPEGLASSAPSLRLVASRADIRKADEPDTSTIDFMELVDTPTPTTAPDFDHRVYLVVGAVQGLDRQGIHQVFEAAGKVARLRADEKR